MITVKHKIYHEHCPTSHLRSRIADLAVAGIPLYLIAEIVELDEDTVKKHYKRELSTAEPIMIERVAKTIVMQALAGCPKSQALYAKTKGAKFGWVEKQVIETVSGEDSQALKDKILELEGKADKEY